MEKDAAEYLAEQDRLTEQFRGRMGELGEMAAVGEQIETANLAAIAQLETTINNLKYMDFHGDLEAAGKRDCWTRSSTCVPPGTASTTSRRWPSWPWPGSRNAWTKSIPRCRPII